MTQFLMIMIMLMLGQCTADGRDGQRPAARAGEAPELHRLETGERAVADVRHGGQRPHHRLLAHVQGLSPAPFPVHSTWECLVSYKVGGLLMRLWPEQFVGVFAFYKVRDSLLLSNCPPKFSRCDFGQSSVWECLVCTSLQPRCLRCLFRSFYS